jgi:hypothetical protein
MHSFASTLASPLGVVVLGVVVLGVVVVTLF